MKRSIPVFAQASILTRTIRQKGCQVWICTTRPYLRLDNIDPDTRHWLRRNKIQYDGVLYGDQKYRDLVKIVGRDRIVAVLDDLPEQTQAAMGLGLKVFLREGDHNEWWRNSHEGIETVSDLDEAWQRIHKEIRTHPLWRAR